MEEIREFERHMAHKAAQHSLVQGLHLHVHKAQRLQPLRLLVG